LGVRDDGRDVRGHHEPRYLYFVAFATRGLLPIDVLATDRRSPRRAC
jgi:hypothetical protein